jgi:hypothetical protein
LARLAIAAINSFSPRKKSLQVPGWVPAAVFSQNSFHLACAVHSCRRLMLSSTIFFARWAAKAAMALFFIYAFNVAAVALPIRPFATAWQISMIDVIINNSIFPLLGLVLAHLAAYLDPSEPRFEAFSQNLRSWALLATLGFLLIIPLQAYNLAKEVGSFRQNATTEQRAYIWSFGKDSVRSILSAAAFAFAFGAGAKRSTWSESLLDGFTSRRRSRSIRPERSGIAQIVSDIRAKRQRQSELNQSRRKMLEHASRVQALKKQEEKQVRLKENHLKQLKARDSREDRNSN